MQCFCKEIIIIIVIIIILIIVKKVMTKKKGIKVSNDSVDKCPVKCSLLMRINFINSLTL